MTDRPILKDEWCTPNEVADHLKIPLATLYRWNHTRTGPPAHRFGKHIRYRASDVSDWIEARSSALRDGAEG